MAINLLGTIGADEAVRAEAVRRFDDSPIGGGSGDPISPDIEAATLAVVAQLLRAGDYDAMLERYQAAQTPQEEMRSLGALAVFPDVDLCLRTFDLAMTEVRSQNGFAVLSSLLVNPVGARRYGPGSPRPGTRSSSGSRRTRRHASSSRFRPCAPTRRSPRMPSRSSTRIPLHPDLAG